ncbi:hypothetical protein QNO07_21615 [Streptomyces sp. 549]|uniref:hypothetical protein n=1 Tax=Streptomyces sp. 549 TaxID=3049076 RepID=UPI0024C2567B|nr:hypothetical protein [Streptomyces sp. 549]MDK1475983.1 hypothetical protein [Streptomyces sp. 549]
MDWFAHCAPVAGTRVEVDINSGRWTVDVVGWLGEVIADSAARLGVRTPLLITVTRAPQR